MDLIPMKDFVLTPMLDLISKKTLDKLEPYQYHNYSHSCNIKYAKFLNRELKIWMFIPCDKDGKILEEPIHIFSDHPDKEKSLMYQKSPFTKAYVEAKEKCLFDGFKVIKDATIQLINKNYVAITNEKYQTIYFETEISYCDDGSIKPINIIDDLTKYNMKLTETVNKELGL